MLLCLGASIWLFEAVVALLVPRGWITVAASAWFGLSILWANGLQWWIFGLQTFPSVFFDLLCVYGFLRYYADGASTWAWVSGAALAAGLAFYEKPAYVPFYLVLVRVLFMGELRHPRALAAAFWRERALWLTYLGVLAVWGIAYLSLGTFDTGAGHVSISEYLQYFRILWLETLVPALLGLTVPYSALTAAQIVGVVALQLAVLVGVLASVRRRSSAWRAWVFLAAVILANGVLVAKQRVPIFGVSIASDRRYLIDFSWIVPLAACFAFAPTRYRVPGTLTPRGPIRLPRSQLRVALAVATLLTAYAAVSVSTAAKLERNWPALQARHWDQNVQRALALISRAHLHPVLADHEVPPEIIGDWQDPYSRLSRVLPLYNPAIQVDGPLDGQLVTLDPAGNPHRARIGTVVAGGSAVSLARRRLLIVAGGGTQVVNGRLCVATGAAPGRIHRTLVLAPASTSLPYYLYIHYSTIRLERLGMYVDPGTGFSPAKFGTAVIRPGVAASLSWIRSPSLRGLVLVLPPYSHVCLDQLDVVTLADAGGV
jgi:hypothetical protein